MRLEFKRSFWGEPGARMKLRVSEDWKRQRTVEESRKAGIIKSFRNGREFPYLYSY